MDVKRLLRPLKNWKVRRRPDRVKGRSSMRRKMAMALVPTLIALLIVGALGSYQLQNATSEYDRVLNERLQDMLVAEDLALTVTDAERYLNYYLLVSNPKTLISLEAAQTKRDELMDTLKQSSSDSKVIAWIGDLEKFNQHLDTEMARVIDLRPPSTTRRDRIQDGAQYERDTDDGSRPDDGDRPRHVSRRNARS